ncbi:MAG: hypothetical protein RMI43_07235 [Candidatus Caldarchaeum sp.]|nr:hypothetical protein [Candidatus Caldarchaeum sp.]MDW8063948.1 hypothetical protein [Candidatus Caldarchaeum sp.]
MSQRRRMIYAPFFLWAVGGIIVFLLITAAVNPPGPFMGVVQSPMRIAYWHGYVFLVELPLALLLTVAFQRREEWRAPPGRYVPGRKYPFLSTWHLTAAAIMAAFYAGTGFIVGITNIDVVALSTALLAVYFGPLVTLISISVGALIRFALGGLSFISPAGIVAFAVSDACRWAIIGAVYWFLVRAKGRGIKTVGYWVVMIPVALFVHGGSVIMSFWSQGPFEWVVGNISFMALWYPTSFISYVIGMAAAEGLHRATIRQPTAVTP